MPTSTTPAIGRHTPRPRRSGFTLIELVVSLSILTVLVFAMGSAVLLALKSIDNGTSPAANMASSREVAGRISSDLRFALNITEQSSGAITMTVPDRDNDQVPETIRYAWSGTPGHPLTRQYNGGAVVNLLEEVYEFNLDYITQPGEVVSAPPIESGEQLFLEQHLGTINGGSAEFSLDADAGVAQHFAPVLPADAVSWRITRIHLMISPKNPANGTVEVSVRPAEPTGEPSATVVESVLIPESNFSSNTWYEVQFSDAGGLDPSLGHFVVVTNPGGSVSGLVKTNTGSTDSPQTRFFYFDAGTAGAWQEDTAQDTWVFVRGTVTEPDPNAAPPSVVRSVRITLNQRQDASSAVRLTSLSLNEPGDLGP